MMKVMADRDESSPKNVGLHRDETRHDPQNGPFSYFLIRNCFDCEEGKTHIMAETLSQLRTMLIDAAGVHANSVLVASDVLRAVHKKVCANPMRR